MVAQINDHAARLTGILASRLFSDGRLFAVVQVLVAEYYGVEPALNYDRYNLEAEALGATIVFHADALPDLDTRRPLLADKADLHKLRPPDPQRAGRFPFLLEAHRVFAALTGKPSYARFCGPFTLAAMLRGLPDLLEDVVWDKPFAHDLLTFLCDEVIAPWVRAQREAIGDPGARASGADAWASPPNLSPALFEEYVCSYADRLRDALGPNVSVGAHWGESYSAEPERVIDLKLRCSPGKVYGADPDVRRLGPVWYRNSAARRGLPLALGIDADLIGQGPVEEIVEHIRRYIAAVGDVVPLSLSLNLVPRNTPPLHVHSAVDAIKTLIPCSKSPVLSVESPVQLPARESWNEFMAYPERRKMLEWAKMQDDRAAPQLARRF